MKIPAYQHLVRLSLIFLMTEQIWNKFILSQIEKYIRRLPDVDRQTMYIQTWIVINKIILGNVFVEETFNNTIGLIN